MVELSPYKREVPGSIPGGAMMNPRSLPGKHLTFNQKVVSSILAGDSKLIVCERSSI